MRPKGGGGRHTGTGVLAGSSLPSGTPPSGSCCPSRGIGVERHEPDVFTICEDEPLSAVVRCERRYGLARPGLAHPARIGQRDARRRRHVPGLDVAAFENEQCLFTRTWTFDIPRDGV